MADEHRVPEEMSHPDLAAEVKRLRRDLKWAQDQVAFNDDQEGRLERYFDKVRDRATDAHDDLRAARHDLAQAERSIERISSDLSQRERDVRVRDAQLEAQAVTLKHYHIVIEHLGAELERHGVWIPARVTRPNLTGGGSDA